MKWLQASLLDTESILNAGCEPNSYSLVVDKGTADSIACGNEFEVRFPFALSSPDSPPDNSLVAADAPTELFVHPLHILALNLALVTIPGALWISFSYSESRFRFLELDTIEGAGEEEIQDDEALPAVLLHHGFPDPRRYWELEFSVVVETAKMQQDSDSVVHPPEALHYMFVLRRTDVKLEPLLQHSNPKVPGT
jgi:EEF1A lysine methyltransferase 4